MFSNFLECSIGASKYLNCLEFEKKIYFSANIISFIPSISASKQIELYEISNNFLWLIFDLVELIDEEMYYMVIYDERYIHIFQAPLLFEILYEIKDRK